MTDTNVIPDDFKSEFPCLTCDKSFPSRLGLQGHMTSHRPPRPCPECGKEYKTAGALGNHRKAQHGVIAMSAPAAVEPLKRGRPPQSKNIVKTWHADDIFGSVVQTLWPAGSVPVRCIVPLMEWREATREFLEKVQSE